MALSPAQLAELLAKYESLRRLREAHEALEPHPEKAVFRELARTCPGALVELDTLSLDELRAREQAVRGALGGGAEQPWMLWMSLYHGLFRGALRIKAQLRGRRAVSEDEAKSLADEGARVAGLPLDAAFATAVARPPQGRIANLVWSELSRLTQMPKEALKHALFTNPERPDKTPMDPFQYNVDAWNGLVAKKNRWTQPVSPEEIARARQGVLQLLLTPNKHVPRDWFGHLTGRKVLCLASGGGQQAPLLAAAGAAVVSFDASPAQLDQDRLVAEREGLSLAIERGDMRDLSRFADGSFDLVFHPVSNCFVAEVRPVYREIARVLRQGGALLAGFANPILYCFDPALEKQGILTLKYPLPHSDLDLTQEERDLYFGEGEPINFAHSLEDQLGGQLDAGLSLTAMFEDTGDPVDASSHFFPGFIATRAVKL